MDNDAHQLDGLHVCHVVLALDLGGLERVALDLIRMQRARGYQVSVLFVERPGVLSSELNRLSVQSVSMDKPVGVYPSLIGRVARIFREWQPEVIHSHHIVGLEYAGPAAWRANVPVVVHTEHGKHFAHSRKARWFGWFAARYAHRVFGVSSDIVQEIVGCRVAPATKVVQSVNGIDTQRFAIANGAEVRRRFGIAGDQLVIGTVGRLAEVKRQDVLLQGFAKHLIAAPSSILMLVGDGPERAALESLSRELGIDSRVVFAGVQSRPEDFLAAFDVFALTSRSEGTPLSILEAWAAGKPVIASAVGGIPELVLDGHTGLLFPSANPETLSEKLTVLARDEELRNRLGESGRARAVAEFDIKVMADCYDRHYSELLSLHGHPRRLLRMGSSVDP